MSFLQLKNVSSGYGHSEILHGVSINVELGQVVSLIGTNGAGKTTLMMTISGMPRLSSGSIIFNGDDISHQPTEKIIRRGIGYVPEGRRIFPHLTVLENLQMGAYFTDKKFYAGDLDNILTTFPRLKDRLSQSAGTMSGGEQQMLAIGRAIIGRPKLLLLDEPSLGLAPIIVKQIFEKLLKLRLEMKLSLLVVEQNAKLALSVADYGYVLRGGKITLSGSGQNLLHNPDVQSEYLAGHR